MSDLVTQYYRCPEGTVRTHPSSGMETSVHGSADKPSANFPARTMSEDAREIEIEDLTFCTSFSDPSQAIDHLRSEKYVPDWREAPPVSTLARMYYFARPILPVAIRRHLQKFYFRDWKEISFPRWPVDSTVDDLHEQLLLQSLRASGSRSIPFIWFWPEGASSCAIMTHDVETAAGRDLCGKLMDIDDSYGIKSSFQIIPEQRYVASPAFLDSIRSRSFEIVIHDLNHDGHLYRDCKHFLERAAKINAYGKLFGAQGFRAGSLYRKQVWYDALDFDYDMSIPNVAHLDPQRGGCCTVMPYFLGDILELPVTTSQDYTLFHILNDYSISLWRQQTDLIMEKHGLMSFIAHPDYLAKPRGRDTYEELLHYLVSLRKDKHVWMTTPGEVNRWWRERANMRLVEEDGGWRIEGAGKERARVAYASEEQGRLFLTLQAELPTQPSSSTSITIECDC